MAPEVETDHIDLPLVGPFQRRGVCLAHFGCPRNGTPPIKKQQQALVSQGENFKLHGFKGKLPEFDPPDVARQKYLLFEMSFREFGVQ